MVREIMLEINSDTKSLQSIVWRQKFTIHKDEKQYDCYHTVQHCYSRIDHWNMF